MNRIIILCLKKKWNVQYGLHEERHPIAVPFEAKGVASKQAEFGHPDVAIIFTCLAFYFSGLSRSQFCTDLKSVLGSHDPPSEYDRWIQGSHHVPKHLRHWNIINLDDEKQIDELWNCLKLSRNAINHFLNNFVFPIHAKQFSIKLQASGWDLPQFSHSSSSQAITTGFSGTNDNRMMLPLTIQQHDLPRLHQTNAEVLTYLLQDRNRTYRRAEVNSRRMTEEQLLIQLTLRDIKVLIDAGAFVLEMSNKDLAKAWLAINRSAKGAVYFGADNRAWMHVKGGKADIPLVASAYADNLEECVVYFDEAHCRGIDLKLPPNACGALTLALGQTKDHTVQGKYPTRRFSNHTNTISCHETSSTRNHSVSRLLCTP